MIWAMGAILFQFHAVPQAVVPAASKAAVAVEAPGRLRDESASAPVAVSEKLMLADASASDEIVALEPGRLVLTPAAPAGSSAGASTAAASLAAPMAPASPIAPVIAAARRPEYTGRIGGGPQKVWLGLAVAQHSAATFDAWSTRRAITRSGAQELNPMLKPFAGNGSIYAATQVGPALLDLLGRRMMTSRHPLLRHTWWLPQVLGTAASLAGGTHNLGVR